MKFPESNRKEDLVNALVSSAAIRIVSDRRKLTDKCGGPVYVSIIRSRNLHVSFAEKTIILVLTNKGWKVHLAEGVTTSKKTIDDSEATQIVASIFDLAKSELDKTARFNAGPGSTPEEIAAWDAEFLPKTAGGAS